MAVGIIKVGELPPSDSTEESSSEEESEVCMYIIKLSIINPCF